MHKRNNNKVPEILNVQDQSELQLKAGNANSQNMRLCAAFNGWLFLWMVLFTTTKSG